MCSRRQLVKSCENAVPGVSPCSHCRHDKLRLLHPEGDLDYNKEFRLSPQQEADFWESEAGRILLSDAFNLRDTRSYFRKRPALGAPDPDGWRGREHVSHLFLNDDVCTSSHNSESSSTS